MDRHALGSSRTIAPQVSEAGLGWVCVSGGTTRYQGVLEGKDIAAPRPGGREGSVNLLFETYLGVGGGGVLSNIQIPRPLFEHQGIKDSGK